MTDEKEWLETLRSAPLWQPAARPTVVISPHPDDETLGAGGLIALQSGRQILVSILAVTDGEAAYPDYPGLGSKRRREQEDAVNALGAHTKNIIRLSLPDSGITAREHELAERIKECIDEETLLVAPWPSTLTPIMKRAEGRPPKLRRTPALLSCFTFSGFGIAILPKRLRACLSEDWSFPPPCRNAELRPSPAIGHNFRGRTGIPFYPNRCWRRLAALSKPSSSMSDVSLSQQEFFDRKYRLDPDPWQFATSPYELQRYDEIVRALNGRRFRMGFEPGCSIGVLTEKLARHCEKLAAMDISPTAVETARARCLSYPGVTISVGSLPELLPAGPFDLIVLSEIGYYFETSVLSRLVLNLLDRFDENGLLVAAHWLGVSPDHLLSGDQVHEILDETPGLMKLSSRRFEGFRLDSWRAA